MYIAREKERFLVICLHRHIILYIYIPCNIYTVLYIEMLAGHIDHTIKHATESAGV